MSLSPPTSLPPMEIQSAPSFYGSSTSSVESSNHTCQTQQEAPETLDVLIEQKEVLVRRITELHEVKEEQERLAALKAQREAQETFDRVCAAVIEQARRATLRPWLRDGGSDVMMRIFKHLAVEQNGFKSLMALRAVCRPWRMIASHSSLWVYIHVDELPPHLLVSKKCTIPFCEFEVRLGQIKKQLEMAGSTNDLHISYRKGVKAGTYDQNPCWEALFEVRRRWVALEATLFDCEDACNLMLRLSMDQSVHKLSDLSIGTLERSATEADEGDCGLSLLMNTEFADTVEHLRLATFGLPSANLTFHNLSTLHLIDRHSDIGHTGQQTIEMTPARTLALLAGSVYIKEFIFDYRNSLHLWHGKELVSPDAQHPTVELHHLVHMDVRCPFVILQCLISFIYAPNVEDLVLHGLPYGQGVNHQTTIYSFLADSPRTSLKSLSLGGLLLDMFPWGPASLRSLQSLHLDNIVNPNEVIDRLLTSRALRSQSGQLANAYWNVPKLQVLKIDGPYDGINFNELREMVRKRHNDFRCKRRGVVPLRHLAINNKDLLAGKRLGEMWVPEGTENYRTKDTSRNQLLAMKKLQRTLKQVSHTDLSKPNKKTRSAGLRG
ncbi:hypothetical protein M422DRAFT_248464 [Sphaerobolus stellatus SS14]|uniref:F-box domain-containing protein n=1 Tax=Sphaerobolus stellatus (strain SS14) TaxID=990650 RepID=A0A0C9UW25_SPHS4|nr:hypothetical protein M422DRAFT_248464 [Sphaerobolus stellatus SS14]